MCEGSLAKYQSTLFIKMNNRQRHFVLTFIYKTATKFLNDLTAHTNLYHCYYINNCIQTSFSQTSIQVLPTHYLDHPNIQKKQHTRCSKLSQTLSNASNLLKRRNTVHQRFPETTIPRNPGIDRIEHDGIQGSHAHCRPLGVEASRESGISSRTE